MNALTGLANYAEVKQDAERGHRLRVCGAWALSAAVVLTLAIYGANYYLLSPLDRPFSPKHQLLKPSGSIGIKLGMLGVAMFLLIFLYPLRKRLAWLGRIGTTKHWLDFHIVLGITAPIIIAFHSSFKFGGIAGMAFWIMVAVALSGIVGRYLYAQIPHSLSSAELSLKELASLEEGLTAELADQSVLSPADLEPLLRIPTATQVRQMPLYRAVLLMFALDMARPFRVVRLRIRVGGWNGAAFSLGGLRRTSHPELEHVIQTARRKSSLAKRVAFLARTQQVFHLWHVIHRPFSYTFAVLAVIHIAVVTMLGFM